MDLDNDARGWIMTAVSGVASIICVDLVIRQFPGKKDFRIQDSNAFLSSGLSLSFGVMIFSSLYSMLPSSKTYLQKGGMSPKAATFTMTACFLIGAIGIAVVSQILHRYIPHSVVDCDHKHSDEEQGKVDEAESENHHNHGHGHHGEHSNGHPRTDSAQIGLNHASYGATDEHNRPQSLVRRPSLHATMSRVSQLVNGHKEFCDENGQCFGCSDPCGNDCFKNVLQKRPSKVSLRTASTKGLVRPGGQRTQTMPHERQPLLNNDDGSTLTPTFSGPAAIAGTHTPSTLMNGHSLHKKHSHHSISSNSSSSSSASTNSAHSHANHQHHHHVPTNVFLSIGLQTSTAIALHKIPEGFITYATNHANPRLGFSIFLALFIHNITEGFALALPLYLAINSRWKAMFWSALLGGVSQPLGAGVAALWFKIAKRGSGQGTGEPGEMMYGAMFAVTAGIMAMVSLQLLGESLDLTHSRKLCFVSAFAGMGILGLSSALTA
ncbi:Zinc/iron permease [Massarina eburnea CBS 473.64]|uniref:Zinc/iron permease n=1 Tax=Massarina eburnea CBS 473.64 TaxID=1395130 RepID=A0A6A6RGY2_9PLEO|nr:Zinc/iron permease [Massarina eburnea CBS 473.64]